MYYTSVSQCLFLREYPTQLLPEIPSAYQCLWACVDSMETLCDCEHNWKKK